MNKAEQLNKIAKERRTKAISDEYSILLKQIEQNANLGAYNTYFSNNMYVKPEYFLIYLTEQEMKEIEEKLKVLGFKTKMNDTSIHISW